VLAVDVVRAVACMIVVRRCMREEIRARELIFVGIWSWKSRIDDSGVGIPSTSNMSLAPGIIQCSEGSETSLIFDGEPSNLTNLSTRFANSLLSCCDMFKS
jgi:hypothetical protein